MLRSYLLYVWKNVEYCEWVDHFSVIRALIGEKQITCFCSFLQYKTFLPSQFPSFLFLSVEVLLQALPASRAHITIYFNDYSG